MILFLHTRILKNEMSLSQPMMEDYCPHCDSIGKIEPIGDLVPNNINMRDSKGVLMSSQRLRCNKCERDWTDIYERIYTNRETQNPTDEYGRSIG